MHVLAIQLKLDVMSLSMHVYSYFSKLKPLSFSFLQISIIAITDPGKLSTSSYHQSMFICNWPTTYLIHAGIVQKHLFLVYVIIRGNRMDSYASNVTTRKSTNYDVHYSCLVHQCMHSCPARMRKGLSDRFVCLLSLSARKSPDDEI